MGWDGTPKHGRTKEQFIRDEFTGCEILAENWKGNTYFAAMRSQKDQQNIFGLVVLVRSDGNYWMKKTMDEGSGPYYYGASRKVLAKLSPLNKLYDPESYSYKNAEEWRNKHSEKKVKIVTGKWYNFENPIRFTNGYESTRFKKIEGLNLWENENGQVVRFKAKNYKLTDEA